MYILNMLSHSVLSLVCCVYSVPALSVNHCCMTVVHTLCLVNLCSSITGQCSCPPVAAFMIIIIQTPCCELLLLAV